LGRDGVSRSQDILECSSHIALRSPGLLAMRGKEGRKKREIPKNDEQRFKKGLMVARGK